MKDVAALLIATWYKISTESKAIEKQNMIDGDGAERDALLSGLKLDIMGHLDPVSYPRQMTPSQVLNSTSEPTLHELIHNCS